MITTNVPDFVDEGTGVYPPLGIMYVASYANSHTKWDIEIIDCVVEKMDCAGLEKIIERKKPDVVGIEALSFTLIDAIMVSKTVKKVDPHIKIIGPAIAGLDSYWIKHLLKPEPYACLDALSFHDYCDGPHAPDYQEKLRSVQALFKKANLKPKQLINSETGALQEAFSLAWEITPGQRWAVEKLIKMQVFLSIFCS